MRISTFIILFFATAIYSFAQENDTISIPKEIQQQIEYRDSIYLPINDTKLCYVFCDNDDSLRMVVADGYIAKGVDFKKNCKIEINAPLPYEPKKGNKNVLFLHFQPDFNAEMKDYPSSNLAVFLDIGELGKQDLSKISKNIQLALYTGGPFYKFKTKGKIRGKIEVVNIENDIAHIVLILDFDLVEENITRVKVETYVRIIKQQDINKNFG